MNSPYKEFLADNGFEASVSEAKVLAKYPDVMPYVAPAGWGTYSQSGEVVLSIGCRTIESAFNEAARNLK